MSLNARAMMNAQETEIVPIFLLRIAHEDLDEPFYFSSDPTERLNDDPLIYGTTSQSIDWLFMPFTLVLPDEKDESPPQMRLIIDNLDRSMVELLRSTISPAKVKFYMVMSNALNTVELEGIDFDLTAVSYNAQTIDMTLTVDALATEPYPYGTFNPAQFGGLF